MIEFPFFNMQQLNLDWIIDKIKGMLSFLPDDGTAGQILRRTADGAEWSDEETGGGAVDSVNGQTGTVVLGSDDILMNNNESVQDSVNDLKSAINNKAPVIIGTASGAIATFADGADGMPVKALTIDGVESAVVTRTGANILPADFETGSLIAGSGAPTYNTSYKRSVNFVPIVPNTKYYVKSSAGIFLKYYDENKTGVGNTWGAQNVSNAEITTASNAKYMKVVFPVAMDISDFCINCPSTVTAYDTYQGETFAYPSETVTTLYGVNNIWSDSGAVDVSYCADTKLYTDKKVGEYNYIGEEINVKKHGFNVLTKSWEFVRPNNANVISGQSATQYGNTIFRCWHQDVMQSYNAETGEVIAEFNADSGHGNSITFSGEFYDNGDDYPLAYVTPEETDGNYQLFRVLRLTTASATTVRTLAIPTENCGYYANAAVDPEKNILYLNGYTYNNYHESVVDGNENLMRVTAWDLSNLTAAGDYYQPTFIKEFNIPFISTHQGHAFFDNKIFCLKSETSSAQTVVYVIDPYRERIVSTFANFPSGIKNNECEGIWFAGNGEEYSMFICRLIKVYECIFD